VILGLDPSGTKIGWGLVDQDDGSPLDAGTMRLAREGWAFLSVREQFAALSWKTKLMRRDVTLVAVEDPIGRSHKQSKWNGEILGYCIAEVHGLFGLEPEEWRPYTSGEWKRRAGMKGNATREQYRAFAAQFVTDYGWDALRIREIADDEDAAAGLLIARALHNELVSA